MRRALPLLACLLLAFPLRADDEPQIELTASDARPALNEVVQLTYTFSSPSASIRPPVSLTLKNMVLVAGPSTNTRVVFMNGNMQRSMSFTYFLRGQTTGPAEVGETVWRVGEGSVKSGGYAFEIQPASASPRRALNPLSPFGEDEDPFGFPRSRVAQQRERREAYVDFIATPDRTAAYVGEEVVIQYELVTQADVEGLEYVEPPQFPNCWAEDLEKPERPKGTPGIFEGRRVTRFTLLKKAVAGLAPGTLELPPVKIRLAVRGGGDIFDAFSMFNRQVVERATKPITLKVLPIPGNPVFKGPVGRFELTAKVDRTRVDVEEAVTLKVRLSGSGNLRTGTAEPPQLTVPNARLYPPTSKTESARSGGRPGGATEWSYVLVPLAPGTLTIPPATLEVFDPAAKKIVAKATTAITIKVEGSPTGRLAASSSEKAEIEEVVPTPAAKAGPAPVTNPSVDVANRTVTIPLWVAAALPAGLLVLGGGGFLLRRAVQKSRALHALQAEPGETKERAAARIDRVLRDRLLRWDVPEGASTSALLSRLQERGAPDKLRRELADVFSDLEFLRFAPQLGDYDAKLREVRSKAARVLTRLS